MDLNILKNIAKSFDANIEAFEKFVEGEEVEPDMDALADLVETLADIEADTEKCLKEIDEAKDAIERNESVHKEIAETYEELNTEVDSLLQMSGHKTLHQKVDEMVDGMAKCILKNTGYSKNVPKFLNEDHCNLLDGLDELLKPVNFDKDLECLMKYPKKK